MDKILVVDDEKAYLEDFLSLFSRKAGGEFEILTAGSAEEGFQRLAQVPIAVVVSDQRMPVMTGSEFLGQVARRYPQTVRILLTGYSDIDAVIDAVNEGEIYRYVSKETPLKEIELVIRQGLDRYRIEEANRRLLLVKKRLLKSIAIQENLSLVGTFGQQIHQKLETLVMHLFNYVFQMGKQVDEKKVLREFEHLQGALGRLRELSSFSQAVWSPESGMEKGDVNLLLREAVDRARVAAERNGGGELTLELASRLPEISLHKYSVHRVLKEILENALLFGSKKGRKVVVRSRFIEAPPGGEVESVIRIEIQDNGEGIPNYDIPKSFAPFFTGFATLLPQDQGKPPEPDEYNLGPYHHYGFGLTIAQWLICQRHHGWVDLESELGGGTTAVVTLPLLEKSL